MTNFARATTLLDEAEPLAQEFQDTGTRLDFRDAYLFRDEHLFRDEEEAAETVHDFKNTLAAVSMLSDLMLSELPEKSPAREIARDVRMACNDANSLCERMLASSRDSEHVFERTDLSDVVSRMAPLVAMWAPPATTLRFELKPDLPPLKAAPAAIGQIVMNLVKNAAEALRDRPGVVTVSTDWCELDAADVSNGNGNGNGNGHGNGNGNGNGHGNGNGALRAGGHVCLAVSDTGCGLDEQARTCLLHGAFTSKANGHGLGFASVRRIAASHGAGILLDSEVGAGTTVRVLFQLDQNDPSSTH